MNVKFLGWISSLAGRREMQVDIDNPAKLGDILPFSLQGRSIIIIVNNEPGSGETMVKNTDQVTLMPVISGG
ncbi:MAG: MoaD/ThiS family protein [Theionarchaea archaeon]|nr:MoaD/ThiS family protein [Theionarchaea archaeon]MBU7001130.1 MoaD/ThiS family protein [Theionarchaea archaeon]MBU7019909.1 MoaD/ThiS family protein [Theionarchaea archaeon]MBU7035392.1 MoaD/ThiS family protein [Theionarchaea archaeon]MBU7041324.1 MoaD/ThiS family protein [Theionarchaea archaeon]